MKKNTWHSFAKSHNLVNRIYDMLNYFDIFNDSSNSEDELKRKIKFQIRSLYYVENLAKYFDDKLKTNRKNVELRCNLKDLIYDLDQLKQYLVKET